MSSALLDTSVLWPSLQRDFLLSLAIEGLYRPLWSTAILAELEHHETRKLIERGEEADIAAARARHLLGNMATAFDDALVENWEPHDGTFGLPDANDEHVLAAALVGGAGVIVTSNLKDFPLQCIPDPVRAISPVQFAADTVAVSPDVARRAVHTMAARYSSPPLTADRILDSLISRYQMDEAVELIRAAN